MTSNNRSTTEDRELEENFYAILNVSKDASDKEITQAYHRLGLVYHPDKQKNPENRKNAELLFSKIRKAYDVLINPHKRAIYDSVGVQGLQQEDLQLVVRSKTPQEIREEFERLAKEREERRQDRLTRSEGDFTVGIDMTNLFDSSERFDPVNRPIMKFQDFVMQQNVQVNVTNNDVVTFGGRLYTKDNYGGATINGTLRRVVSPESYFEVNTSIGAMNRLSLTGFKRLTHKCHANLGGMFKVKNGALVPTLIAGVNYQLDTHLIGRLEFKNEISDRSDAVSMLTTSLIYEKDNNYAYAKIRLSPVNSYVSLGYSRAFVDYDAKLKLSLQYGFLGGSLSYGLEKQVTKHSRLSAAIIVNSMAGVFLNIGVFRGSQTFMVPIHLSREMDASVMFYGTVTPLAVYYVVKKLIVDPYQRSQEEEEAKQKQEKLKHEISEKRKMAIVAQNLMKETVARIVEKETPNGLIINKAYYGKILSKINATFEADKFIDVMVPLQFLVQDHALVIVTDQTKSNLEGFYDPCVGEKKTLYIEYTFKNESHVCIAEDTEILRLPKSSHKVGWWSR